MFMHCSIMLIMHSQCIYYVWYNAIRTLYMYLQLEKEVEYSHSSSQDGDISSLKREVYVCMVQSTSSSVRNVCSCILYIVQLLHDST